MADDRGLRGEVTVSSRFLLEVDGVEIGVFAEVSGLELTVAVDTYEEGGENGFSHKLPGRMSWPNLVFKRGITDSDALFNWVGKSSGPGFAANGNKVTRSTGAITLLGSDHKRLRAWEIQAAFPVRWTGPRLDVNTTVPLNEELEVAHHGFRSKTFS
ncbi:MAG: hypothetical protein QOG64_306 [Acidimicrobiaceae bacterium]|nr:hypothetical protein [Acidimicrobiaceae bacterium]MEA2620219.1 hypothetical protein [Chloroflexota bacterium]